MDSEKSRVFVWRVTQDCNLSCRFCSYSQDLSRLRSRADPERVLRFGQVLGEYSRLMSRNVLVSWIGGEPLYGQTCLMYPGALSMTMACRSA